MPDFASSSDRTESNLDAGSPGWFANAARLMAAEPTVQTTLQRIVDLAVEMVEGCDGAGILLLTGQQIVVGAWSDDRIRRVETIESEIQEGPCIDAIREQSVFESTDLQDLLERWPHFAREALAAGIGSMLGFRLFVEGDTLGALDLYGYQAGAFDETSRAVGSALAAHAALALLGSQIHARDLETTEGLRQALENRDIIGQAKGILMATHKIDAETAFAVLTKSSQDQNIKLRTVAEHVARTGTTPQG